MSIRFMGGDARYPVDIQIKDNGEVEVCAGTTPAYVLPAEVVNHASTDVPAGQFSYIFDDKPVDLAELMKDREFKVYWSNDELDAAPADDLVISGRQLWLREHLPEMFSGWECGALSRVDMAPYVALTRREG